MGYQAVFAVRRWDIIIANMLFTQSFPLLDLARHHYLEKVMCFLIVQTFYILYIHEVKPHDESAFNKLELINEYSLMAFGYTMLLFTGVGFGDLTS